MIDRILGDLRIFQSVYNDLRLKHEQLTRDDGAKVWAYTYAGPDPHALEDPAFPGTVAAIKAVEQDTAKAYGGCSSCYGKGYATVNNRWHGRDTDTDIGSSGGCVSGGNPFAMKLCGCDRGQQLEKMVKSSNGAQNNRTTEL